MRTLRQLWRGWLELGVYIGDFQARLLLTVFYFVVVLPFSLIVRLARDPLQLRNAPETSAWSARRPTGRDLASGRRQF
ncbi:MAG: hypothetical protein ACT4P5_07715 [Armatimonadota bacterium]